MNSVQIQRRILLRTYSLEAALAVTAIIGGVLFLVWPHLLKGSALGETLETLGRVWSVTYAIGGCFILIGFWKLDARWEVGGCLVVACCYLIDGYAIFAFRGVQPGLVSASVFVGLCWGLTWRAWTLSIDPKTARFNN